MSALKLQYLDNAFSVDLSMYCISNVLFKSLSTVGRPVMPRKDIIRYLAFYTVTYNIYVGYSIFHIFRNSSTDRTEHKLCQSSLMFGNWRCKVQARCPGWAQIFGLAWLFAESEPRVPSSCQPVGSDHNIP